VRPAPALAALAALAAALALAAACGGGTRSQADQDRDGKAIAAAIQKADEQGVGFQMQEQLVLTGGDIPKGQQATIQATADGAARDGRQRMTYRILRSSSSSISYEMVVANGALFVRQSPSEGWRFAPAQSTTALYPSVRLPLVREAVLLAKSVGSSSLAHPSAGFAHEYKIVPAADQLEQLEAVPALGEQEATFLKSASAEIDVFLSVPGDRLMRIEVHLAGTDPDNGTRQKIDSTVDFHSAKVGTVQVPDSAQQVPAGEILTPSS
jgi:hypothetical protein